MGRRRPQAPGRLLGRGGRAGRLRARAEDRRARNQPHLRGRFARARRDAWRRRPGRGRDREPPHDRDDPVADDRRRAAVARRGARGGLPADLRLPRAQRAPGGNRTEARAESTERGRRFAAAEELRDHGRPAARRLGLRHGSARGPRAGFAVAHARVAARARLPHEPVRRAPRLDRGGREALRRVGAEAHRARLRDRRHRDQGRRARPAAAARRAARAAALGARVQVGADDRADHASTRSRSASAAPATSTRGRCSSRSRSAASPSRARRCTTRRTSTARTSARATP